MHWPGIMLVTVTLVAPAVIGLALYLYYKKSRDSESSSGIRLGWHGVVNSAVLFALAFNLVFMIQEFGLALPKAFMDGVTAVVFHNNHTWTGTHTSVSLAQGGGAVTVFIFALITLGIAKLRHWSGLTAVFMIWLAFNAFIQSLLQVPIALLDPSTDLGQAIAYIGVHELYWVPLAILSVLGLAHVGIITAYALLKTAPSGAHIQSRKDRSAYLIRVGLLGWIVATILIVPFRVPPLHLAIAPVVVGLAAIPWIVASGQFANVEGTRAEWNSDRIAWGWIVALVVLLAVFRLLLARGIPLG